MNSLGIYISVPFCRAKCTYCNFASGVSSVSAHEQYVARVCDEIRSIRRRLGAALIPEQVDSIYLGGGTPSVLSPALLGKLAHTLRQEFAVAPEAEITLECAPGQLDDPALAAMLALGVNRISFGVQSLVDREAGCHRTVSYPRSSAQRPRTGTLCWAAQFEHRSDRGHAPSDRGQLAGIARGPGCHRRRARQHLHAGD